MNDCKALPRADAEGSRLALRRVCAADALRPLGAFMARVAVVLGEAVAGIEIEGAERTDERVASKHTAREPRKQGSRGNLYTLGRIAELNVASTAAEQREAAR